jgi:septal ring factor EnvC (AmiA/AmiB activator)
MAKSPTDQIAELRAELADVREDNAILRERLETALRDLRELQTERKTDAVEQKQQSQQIALLTQRLDDQVKRSDEADRRRWGMITLLVGAVMSLASGLIVSLTKK